MPEKSVFKSMKPAKIQKIGRFFRAVLALAAFAMVFPLAACMYVGGSAGDEEAPLRVTFLDVGQGLAVLLEKDGHYAMYDMGPDSVGVMDSLRSRGVDTLEWVLISHNHRDHAGGFLELGRGPSKPARVHVKRLFVGPDTLGGFVRDSVLRIARRFEIAVDTVVRGASLGLGEGASDGLSQVGDAPRFEVLWPPDYMRLGGNAASVVVDVGYGEGRALLTGDLDSACERRLLELSPTLTAGLLQVPHHGSAGSSSLAFVGQVAPEFAVASVGEKNPYGHPAGQVVRKYAVVLGDSTRFFRTDRDGSVAFSLYRGMGVLR